MSIVIYHNPKCGTSRDALSFIKAAGETPVIINYLETGWTRPQLYALFAVSGLTPKTALRAKAEEAKKLGLTEPDIEDEKIIDAMLAHPVLVDRPIVCSPKGVKMCRPAETVLDLLAKLPAGPLYKEKGAMVLNEAGQRV